MPYEEVINDMLIDRCGCASMVFDLQAPLLESASVGRLVAIQQALVSMFDSVPDRVVQFQYIYLDSEDWADVVAGHARFSAGENYRALDAVRQERARLLMNETRDRKLVRTRTLLVMTVLPLAGVKDRALTDFSKNRSGSVSLPNRTLKPHEIRDAENSLNIAENIVVDIASRAGITLRRLRAFEVAEVLYKLWNPSLSRIVPMRWDYDAGVPFADAWLTDEWELERDGWRVGDLWHGYASMNIKPDETSPRAIEHITTASGIRNLQVTLTIRRIDKGVQRDQLRSYRNKTLQRMQEPMMWIDRIGGKRENHKVDIRTAEYNIEAKEEVDEANRELAEMRVGKGHSVVVQLTAHTWANTLDDLKKQKQILLGRFADINNCRAVSETWGTYYVTKSSLPGSIEKLPRWTKVREAMAADLAPINKGFETGEDPVSCFRNASGGLVTLDLYDSSRTNAPMVFISGASGTGKSVATNLLVMQHMVDNALVVMFDIGGSYTRLAELLGGKILDFGKEFCFNPLQIYGQSERRGVKDIPAKERARIVTSLEAIMTQPEDGEVGMPIEMVNLIDQAVEACFKTGAARNVPYIDISTVFQKFTTYGEEGMRLMDRLRPFVRDQVYGHWMDGPTTVDLKGNFIYIDMKHLRGDKRLAAAFTPVMINFIHDLVMRDRARKKIIVMDEMWEFITNERIMNFVVSAWKTYRKENAVVMGVSQNLGQDIASNPVVAGAVVQNTDTWILLPQGQQDALKASAELLRLTEGQVEMLKGLKAVAGRNAQGEIQNYREALMIRGRSSSRETSGVIQIRPTPREYWLATTHPPEMEYFSRLLDACSGDLSEALRVAADTYPHGMRIKEAA